MINNVSLVGRLGKDIEVKQAGDKKVANFSIAIKRPTKEDATDWIEIQAWGQQAEFAGTFLKKGRLVGVEGRLRQESWVQADGQQRTKTIVVANRVEALDADPNRQQQPAVQNTQPQQQYAAPAPPQQQPQPQQQVYQQQPYMPQPQPGYAPPPQMVPQPPQLLGAPNDGMVPY